MTSLLDLVGNEFPMSAGRELDALVAEKVLGWSWWTWDKGAGPVYTPSGVRMLLPPPPEWMTFRTPATGSEKPFLENLPRFSTEIQRAWEVVACMRESHDYLLELEQYLMNSDDYENWSAEFRHRLTDAHFGSQPVSFFSAPQSAPHAICIAALKAVEGE